MALQRIVAIMLSMRPLRTNGPDATENGELFMDNYQKLEDAGMTSTAPANFVSKSVGTFPWVILHELYFEREDGGHQRSTTYAMQTNQGVLVRQATNVDGVPAEALSFVPHANLKTVDGVKKIV